MPLASGDGVVRRGHPILAVYVGDYPEQVLVTGCKTGECPKCPVPRDEVGDSADTDRPLRNLRKVLDALDTLDQGPRVFKNACLAAGIKPLAEPFWSKLPYTNIYYAITPDILHQLYQGVVKHVLAWVQEAYGKEEIDARCRRLPPNHHLRHFTKGLSHLSRVTGKEHQDICRILLGLIIGLPLPNGVSPARLVRAVRAVLDFLYLAQYTTHTSRTLRLLDEALEAFHANKDIFVDLGVRDHFHLPKLHSLDHYRRSIEFFGTTDNYDTQYSERLHIDMAKDAYRATNKKDELTQMTKWLERREKILRHEKFVHWQLAQMAVSRDSEPVDDDAPMLSPSTPQAANPAPSPVSCPALVSRPSETTSVLPRTPTDHPPEPRANPPPRRRIEMTRHASARSVPLDAVPARYGATYFRDALSRFVVQRNHPEYTRAQQERAAASVYFHFSKIPAYHKVKFWLEDPHGLGLPENDLHDVIHCRPSRKNKYGDDIPGRFDTALVRIAGHESDDIRREFPDHVQ